MPVVTVKDKGVYTFQDAGFQFTYYDSGDLHGNDNFRAAGHALSIYEALNSIDGALLRQTLAVTLDGQPVPLTAKIERDCTLEVLTWETDAGKQIYHDSLAYLLAQSVFEAEPAAQLQRCEASADGCRLQFALAPECALTAAVLEQRLDGLRQADHAIQRIDGMQKEMLLEIYPSLAQPYAQLLLQDYDDFDFVPVAVHDQFALPLAAQQQLAFLPSAVKGFAIETVFADGQLSVTARHVG